MSLTSTIAGRSLRQRPARTLFSVLGIALGIATVVGVFTLDHNTLLGLALPGTSDWRPALEVRPAEGVADPKGELEQTAGVAGVSSVFQNEAVVRRRTPLPDGTSARRVREGSSESDADLKTRARLFALDGDALERIEAVRLLEGRLLDPTAREREVLIGTGLAESLGLSVGDGVLLSRPRRPPAEQCVDGELKTPERQPGELAPELDFTVVGVLARENLGRRAQGVVLVIDSAWAKELYKGARLDPVYWVKQDPKVDIEKLRTSLGASFSYDLNKSVLVGAAADERAFRNGVRMAGLLALVLGLYVIFHTLSISLVERVREVATLDALGATRGQITRIFLSEALVIAGLAAVVGIAGGLGPAPGLLLFGVTTLGTGHRITLFDVPWPEVAALTAAGVGIALLGSVYPLLRARHTSSAQALRGEEHLGNAGVARGFHLFAALLLVGLLPGLYFVIVPVVGEAQGELVGAVLVGVGFLALLVVLPLVVPALFNRVSSAIARPLAALWTFSGRMAARSIRESRTRVPVSAAALALVAAAFVGLKGMTRSLRAEIEQWAQGAIVDKVYLGGLANVPMAELRAQFARYPGFVALENGGARSYVPFLLLGQRASEVAAFGPLKDDPALAARFASGTGVIVSKRLAKHLGYHVGDRVHVANASGSVQDLEVLAISDAYGYFPHPDERIYGVVPDEYVRRAFCIDVERVSECAVVLHPGTDPDVVKAAVRELYPDLRVLRYEPGRALLDAHLADIDRDFRLFDLILTLTALLAGLGVLNGQLLAALERAKELGVLKALGTSRRQIAGMVLCEALVIGLFGGLLGTALGAGLTPVIVRALEGLSGLELPHVGAGPWLVLCPLGSVVVAVLAALYPVLRMQRMDAVAAVRTG
ncbi:MAG: ABC transporter permease [Planctomycetes bacterium]|nr:ABC transporter permease [Planctomycetota bacterium]